MRALLWVAAVSWLVTGCVPGPYGDTARNQPGQERLKERDVPAWYTERQRITEAMGDRAFDKGFARVFDSVIDALASAGMTVDKVERQSGYIAAHGPLLPPGKSERLLAEELDSWARANGSAPSTMKPPDEANNMRIQTSVALTVSVVRQTNTQTKVKVRFNKDYSPVTAAEDDSMMSRILSSFNGVYYPKTLEECYRTLWSVIDKQMFINRAMD